jgi:hypothetical protein
MPLIAGSASSRAPRFVVAKPEDTSLRREEASALPSVRLPELRQSLREAEPLGPVSPLAIERGRAGGHTGRDDLIDSHGGHAGPFLGPSGGVIGHNA